MLPYLIPICIIVVSLILIYIDRKLDTFWICVTGVVLVFFGFLWLILVPYDSMENNKAYNNFVIQREYYRTHIPKNQIEDAAITADKIKRNDWLYNAQYYKKLFGDFGTMPKEVLDLKPIE